MTEFRTPEMLKVRYEQLQQLFIAALNVEPSSDRENWLRQQKGHDEEILLDAIAMVRSDAIVQERQISTDSQMLGLPIEAGPKLSTAHWQSASFPKQAMPFPRLENYEILGEIARGGMGVVYKARQLRPSRYVAIKMIRAGSFASTSEIERFLTEANAAAQVDDESVVPVYEFGEVRGEPFIAMKWIEGENLEQLMRRNAIAIPAFLNLLVTVCRAISAAHQRGIIHRDIKPSNILVEGATGRPWITDFGLAKYLEKESGTTAAGEVMGTPGYMAPEQALGDANAVTRATDVYGLGAVLYRALTGRPPIHSDSLSMVSVIQRIREHDVVPPRSLNRSTPHALNTICMKCLETEASRRYPDAGEMAEDLQRFLDGEAIHAKPLGWMRRLHRWARHRPGLAVTWSALSIFYAYHLSCAWFGWYSNPAFDVAATLITISTALSAWVWQHL